MADTTTEIDLDSVIDRLLEGELACCNFVIMIGRDIIGGTFVIRALAEGWVAGKCAVVGRVLSYAIGHADFARYPASSTKCSVFQKSVVGGMSAC
jgi:hypothetical protein